MRLKIVASLVVLLISHSVLAGSVQCNCPEVDAKGTGDTSCSATESGSQCTIDFNTFNFDDERSAFELLSSVSEGNAIFVDLESFNGTRFLNAKMLLAWEKKIRRLWLILF